MNHLAVVRQPFYDMILKGEKTIESRWSLNRCAPYKKIAKGDTIFFKLPGRPISMRAKVTDVKFFVLTPALADKVAKDYGKQIGIASFPDWEGCRNKKYLTLIWLDNVTAIDKIKIEKKGRAAWVVLDGNIQSKILNQLNDGLSAYVMGRNFYSAENGYEQDYKLSYEIYKYGVEKFDDPRCLYGYAMFYFDDGESESENVVDKDNALANELFAKAYPRLVDLSNSGDVFATFILGAYHNYGLGRVEKSFENALPYIEKAASLGHSGACYDLGRFYEIGKGVKKDLKTSADYYRKAAELGNLRAAQKLTQRAL